jgi:hypothetical protein
MANIEVLNEINAPLPNNGNGFFMSNGQKISIKWAKQYLYWDEERIKERLDPLFSRTIDQIHKQICKKQNEINYQKNKAIELNKLRPASKRDKAIVRNLNSREIGCIHKPINEVLEKSDFKFKRGKNYDTLHTLDTLALLGTLPKQNEKLVLTDKKLQKSLHNRAKAKYHTLQYLPYLIKLNSPLKNSYCNTLTCSESIISKDGILNSAYCKNRWCQVCNRIKTANLINGYQPELEKLQEKRFCTFSFQNVKANDLTNALKHYNKWWRIFYLYQKDQLKKYHRELKKAIKDGLDTYDLEQHIKDIRLAGIKKLECTYNSNENSNWYDTYHPHIHLLIRGEKMARDCKASWIKYCRKNGLKLDLQAQQIKEPDDNVCKELFKYFSKIASSTGKKTKKGHDIKKLFVHAMDQMFCSMKGFQVFTAFGIDKIVDEDFVAPEYTSDEIDDVCNWKKNDWFTKDNRPVSLYKPTVKDKNRKKYIVLDKTKCFIGRMPRNEIIKKDGWTYIIKEKMNYLK